MNIVKFLKEVAVEPYIPESELPILRPRGATLLIFFILAVFIMLYLSGLLRASPLQISSNLLLSFGAILWFAASVIPTPVPLGYVSSPPEKVVKRIKYQGRCNAFGAAFTSIGIVLQIYANSIGS